MHVHASSDSLTIHTCRNFSLLRSNNCAFFLLPPNNCVFSPFAAKQLNSYSEMRPGPQWEAGLSGVQGNDFPKPTEERSSPPRARRTGKKGTDLGQIKFHHILDFLFYEYLKTFTFQAKLKGRRKSVGKKKKKVPTNKKKEKKEKKGAKKKK